MSRNNQNNKTKNKNRNPKGSTKTFQIPLNLKSISTIIGIAGGFAYAGYYIGISNCQIQKQDEKHQLQCEILRLKEQILEDKENFRAKEEELYLKIRTLMDENSELKSNRNGK